MESYKEWLQDAIHLRLESLKKRNRILSQWELDQILFGLVHYIFSPIQAQTQESIQGSMRELIFLESVDPIMKFLVNKMHASPFYKNPRFFKSANDIVQDYLSLPSNEQVPRLKKIAIFFKTHFRLQVNVNAIIKPDPRGSVLPSKHIMTRELHSMLETLERWNQNVSLHISDEAIRVGKLSSLSSPVTVNLYRLVINDVLFWLEKWIQRYGVKDFKESSTSNSSSSSSSSSGIELLKSAMDTVMKMDSEVEKEKEKWLSILKTLNKWYSFGSFNIVTTSVVEALEKTNQEQTHEMIRLDREIKRLEELSAYNGIIESDGVDHEIKDHVQALQKDKLALDYRSESLHELIETYKTSNPDLFSNQSNHSNNSKLRLGGGGGGGLKNIGKDSEFRFNVWPDKNELRKIDSSLIQLQNQAFALVPGVDNMYKCIRLKNKDQKYWFIMPVNKSEKDVSRMQQLADKYIRSDSTYFVSIVGYIEDAKMMGLLLERCKTTLAHRLSPEFTISFFETRKKFHVSLQERLLMCHRLLQGYLQYPSLISPYDISNLKNIALKLDHGIWISKWIFSTASEMKPSDLSNFNLNLNDNLEAIKLYNFGLLIKQILEWRACPENEIHTHAYQHLWNIPLQESEKKRSYDITSLTLVLERCFLKEPCISLYDLDIALTHFKRHYLFF